MAGLFSSPKGINQGSGAPGPIKGSSAIGGYSIPQPAQPAPKAAAPRAPLSTATQQTTQLSPGPVQAQPPPAQSIPATPAAPLVNTSTPNPTVESTVLPTLLERAKGGMGAPEAIRLATGAIRDNASGLLKENEEDAARRGVGGSGAERIMKRQTTDQAQRDIAGQTAKISYAAEQDRNELYKDTASMALASDASQREDRRLGLAQHESGVNQSLSQQRINQDRDNNLLRVLTSDGMF